MSLQPLFLDLGLMTSQQLELSRTFFVLLLQTSPQKRGERRTNCRLYFGGEPCLFPVINAIYINHPGRERAGGNCGSYSDRRLIWETEGRGGGLGPSALFIYFSFFPPPHRGLSFPYSGGREGGGPWAIGREAAADQKGHCPPTHIDTCRTKRPQRDAAQTLKKGFSFVPFKKSFKTVFVVCGHQKCRTQFLPIHLDRRPKTDDG